MTRTLRTLILKKSIEFPVAPTVRFFHVKVSDAAPAGRFRLLVLCGIVPLMLLLGLLLCFPRSAASQVGGESGPRINADSTVTARRQAKSPRGAMLRALVPGWGQFYNGQVIKGMIVVAGQGTLIGLSLYYDQESKNFPVGSQDKDLYIDRRNLTFWLMGGLTLLSMLDAYIDAHLFGFDTGPDLGLRLGAIRSPVLALTPVSLGMSLRAKF